MKRPTGIILLVTFLSTQCFADCWDGAKSTTDATACAVTFFKDTTAQMESVYKRLISVNGNRTEYLAKIQHHRQLVAELLETEDELLNPEELGSIRPMCNAIAKSEMQSAIAKVLTGLTHPDHGDICGANYD